MIPNPDQVENIQQYVDLWQGFRDRVLVILKGVSEHQFQKSPPAGGWSASQIAEHLYLSQFFIARAIPATLAGKIGAPADQAAVLNYKEVEEGMARPTGIKNPDPVTPSNEWNLTTSEEKLEIASKKLVKNITDRSLTELKSRAMPHGVFGHLTVLDYIWTLVMHERLHLISLEEKFGK